MVMAEVESQSATSEASQAHSLADSTGDPSVASSHSHARAGRAPEAARPTGSTPRTSTTPVDADSIAGRQQYVEVLIFIDSGPLKIGHADIAVTDSRGTMVYGQHGRGQGNGGFDGSAFQRRTLDTYLRQEAASGFRVYVSRIPVTEQQFREIGQYLDHKWQNDDDFHLVDDNCSQNVGYVLKRWDLLSAWEGGPNVINDDNFQLPEGDLYDDFIRGDTTWAHRDAGYLTATPGGPSLFDSVQNRPPIGITPARDSSGSTTSGDRSSGTSSSSSGRRGNGGGRSGRLMSEMSDDDESGGRDDADWIDDLIRGSLTA